MNREWEYIGNTDQLLQIKNYRLEGGWGDGVRATDITNQKGLSFTVIADRCMDISELRYKGVNISYQNPCGIVAPHYFNDSGTNWLRSFAGGFLTTCGLDNIGSPCTDGGINYGLHGRISNIPASQYRSVLIETKEGLEAVLSGEMIQSVMFGDKLVLKRQIRAYQKQNRIEMIDEICNMSYKDQEYMLLYHFNIGYPFLAPGCKVLIESEQATPRNEHAECYQAKHLQITEPDELEEMCYYHKMKNHDGYSAAGIYQPAYRMGFKIQYENSVLDHFTQWKNLSKGQYVLGLEPATNGVDGKETERRREGIKYLPPGTSIRQHIQIQFYDDEDKNEV